MDNFNLTKFFRNQYLAEGEWKDLSSKDLEDYKDDIIGLILKAYSYIGGHSNFSTSDDIGKEAARGADYEVIDLDNDGDIDAVNVSKTKSAGTKFVATGHNGSSQAKRAVITHKIDRLKRPGFYVEVSGKIQDILLKAGVHQVTDEATIEKALAGKDVIMNKDGSYKRKIGGAWHEKILLGQPIT
tara:strand:- start:539 stop:1093 length:555 start_codon:yes stop_codon:yes gene_type:complete